MHLPAVGVGLCVNSHRARSRDRIRERFLIAPGTASTLRACCRPARVRIALHHLGERRDIGRGRCLRGVLSCDDPVRSRLPMVAPQPASAKAASSMAARPDGLYARTGHHRRIAEKQRRGGSPAPQKSKLQFRSARTEAEASAATTPPNPPGPRATRTPGPRRRRTADDGFGLPGSSPRAASSARELACAADRLRPFTRLLSEGFS